eukprot:TRINITY_DN29436_c0_g1_i1.p1 TRINITY_DN29436_c0_g1~~TRINITY_DN29436_c0_g1_i1.p1  ORF type:complete len:360 (+),score=47.65 TRINITY_DN29436_c0_g1_i1:139-1218(+)
MAGIGASPVNGTLLVPHFNGFDFTEDDRAKKVDELRSLYNVIRCQSDYTRIEDDPILSPLAPEDQEALLKRYLIAEDFVVSKAAERLECTVAFRKQWNVLEFHEADVAAQLLPEAANPGAEAYFVDSLLSDKDGAPYIVARLKLCNTHNMHPWRHLRAALFVLERAAVKVKHPLQQACFLLDVSDPDFTGTYGPTGGVETSQQSVDQSKSRSALGAKAEARYGARTHPNADLDDAHRVEQELLAEFGDTEPGLSVLKVALKLFQSHYPDLLRKVFFINSDISFFVAFKIFSLWVHSRTRAKFVFIGPNRLTDHPFSTLREYISEDQLFAEYEGSGPSLDGDQYIRRAVAAYDANRTVLL